MANVTVNIDPPDTITISEISQNNYNITTNTPDTITVEVENATQTGGGGSTAWGDIIGNLPDQTDLQNALNGKENSLGFTPANSLITITGTGLLLGQGGDLSANRTFNLVDSDINHDGLTNTHNLTTDIDHTTITNGHNLTTDINHNTILNNHNLTTDINHNSLTNTHNLSTDIDHAGLTNTHNLTTDITHNNINGLTTGDPHTQYAYLAGRAGGQSLIGGTAASNNLTLESTSNVTKGDLIFNSNMKFGTGYDYYVQGTNYAFRSAAATSAGLRFTVGTVSLDCMNVSGNIAHVLRVSGSTENYYQLYDLGNTKRFELNSTGWAEMISDTDTGREVLYIKQNDADQAFIELNGTSAANTLNSISTLTTGNSIQGFTKWEVNGFAVWIPYYNAPTA
jgi:hypothetical protein